MNKKGCGVLDAPYPAGSLAEVAQLVDVVSKRLTQITRQGISAADLTPAQYSILTMLWEKDGHPFSELAAACCCSRSTVTGIVDTMEKNGLVRREANPDDRRSTLVKLNEEGKALEQSIPTLEGIFKGCCAGITPDELQQLGELLNKLNDTLTA